MDLTLKMIEKNTPQYKQGDQKKSQKNLLNSSNGLHQEKDAGGAFGDVHNPLWFSISETAKLGGVQSKTIRRAIQSNAVKYKVIKNRYLVDFTSVIIYLRSKKKLRNKLDNFGVGQYINEWKE